jgi:N6-L-threonylcarbamoyladenine synthase
MICLFVVFPQFGVPFDFLFRCDYPAPIMPQEKSLILGIESSCDESAASIVRDGRQVLSNVVASQHDLHAKFGGVVPEIASRAHIERMLPVINEALDAASVRLEDVDAIAVGNRPGLIGSLLVGVAAAKALAWSLGKPLIGVDHLRAHLYAAALDEGEITYPALGLVISGGHSALYTLAGPNDLELIGSTIDDAVGEAYDKVAAIMQFGFPGGPIVDKRAREGDPKSTRFPRTLLGKESLDFSFSGLKTAVLYKVRGHPQGKGRETSFPRDASALSDQEKNDVAAAFQAAAVDVLFAKVERALVQQRVAGAPPQSLVIGGGVSANSAVRARAEQFGKDYDVPVCIPKMGYCVDNAAMIAGLAHHAYVAQRFDDLTLEALATTAM